MTPHKSIITPPLNGGSVRPEQRNLDVRPVNQVIHVTQTVGRQSYGVGQVAMHLTREQANLGVPTQVWTFDGPEDIAWAAENAELSAACIHGFPRSVPHVLGYSRAMQAAARAARFEGKVIVHQHLIWLLLSRTPGMLRRAGDVRVVIAPHGTLDAWALRKSPWRKRLATWIYEGQNLHAADCLHATSQKEVRDFRDFGLRNPIALINNGVSSSWVNSVGDAAAFRSRFDLPPDRRIILFISRIARKKGLPMLLEAMHQLRHRLAEWLLVIAGVDEEGHEAEVAARAQELGLTERLKFIGPIFGQPKRDAMAAAELFVLPSHSEGAPMIVLEALAAEVPVLTTHVAPWEELVRHDCGWWVEPSVAGLVVALEAVATLPAERWPLMRRRAKELVARNYAWSEIASQTLQLYAWLHGEGNRPAFVHTN